MFSKFMQKKLVEAAIRNVAYRHKIKIHTLFVMPEHVHMLVTLPHNVTDSKALMLLKGGSAYIFFKHHPKSRLRLPKGHLWSAGGCATTVGYNEFATVENYIANQTTHHAQAYRQSKDTPSFTVGRMLFSRSLILEKFPHLIIFLCRY